MRKARSFIVSVDSEYDPLRFGLRRPYAQHQGRQCEPVHGHAGTAKCSSCWKGSIDAEHPALPAVALDFQRFSPTGNLRVFSHPRRSEQLPDQIPGQVLEETLSWRNADMSPCWHAVMLTLCHAEGQPCIVTCCPSLMLPCKHAPLLTYCVS